MLFLQHEFRRFDISCSPGVDRAMAGVITLIEKKFVGNGMTEAENLATGRVLRTTALTDGRETIIYNVHNYGLNAGQVDLITSRIKRDQERARLDPLNISVWVLGDFNFLPPGCFALSVRSPLSASSVGAAPANAQDAARWTGALERMVELQQMDPTHYLAMSGTMSRLDRIYTTVPSWSLAVAAISCEVVGCPERLHAEGLSDHAPVRFTIAAGTAVPTQERPIPKEVFSDPLFVKYHDRFYDDANLDSLPPIPRWQHHKTVIKLAAKYTRNEMFLNSSNPLFTEHLSATSHVLYGGTTAALLVQSSDDRRKLLRS